MPKEIIRYACFSSPVGQLAAAVTERGLAYVGLTQEESAVSEQIARYYPGASIEQDGTASRLRDAVLSALVGESPAVPLDLRGTPFQLRIWQALQTIPYGATTTYSALARQIGHPNAVRAAGSACGANPVCIIVPCHRVLRSNGELGGYAYGLPMKRQLLEREANQMQNHRRAMRPGTIQTHYAQRASMLTA